jgi:hypothetical protein
VLFLVLRCGTWWSLCSARSPPVHRAPQAPSTHHYYLDLSGALSSSCSCSWPGFGQGPKARGDLGGDWAAWGAAWGHVFSVGKSLLVVAPRRDLVLASLTPGPKGRATSRGNARAERSFAAATCRDARAAREQVSYDILPVISG